MKVYIVKFQCFDDVRIQRVFLECDDANSFYLNSSHKEYLEIIEMDVY